MATNIQHHHIQFLVICTLLILEITTTLSASVSDSDNNKQGSKLIKRSVLLDDDDDNAIAAKRFSSFRSDLGKRMSSYRSDLGKRSSEYMDSEIRDIANERNINDEDIIKRIVLRGLEDNDEDNNDEGIYDDKRASFRADLGKRFSSFRSDLGKRGVGILTQNNAPEDLLETIKRYGGMGFRADLGMCITFWMLILSY